MDNELPFYYQTLYECFRVGDVDWFDVCLEVDLYVDIQSHPLCLHNQPTGRWLHICAMKTIPASRAQRFNRAVPPSPCAWQAEIRVLKWVFLLIQIDKNCLKTTFFPLVCWTINVWAQNVGWGFYIFYISSFIYFWNGKKQQEPHFLTFPKILKGTFWYCGVATGRLLLQYQDFENAFESCYENTNY